MRKWRQTKRYGYQSYFLIFLNRKSWNFRIYDSKFRMYFLPFVAFLIEFKENKSDFLQLLIYLFQFITRTTTYTAMWCKWNDLSLPHVICYIIKTHLLHICNGNVLAYKHNDICWTNFDYSKAQPTHIFNKRKTRK